MLVYKKAKKEKVNFLKRPDFGINQGVFRTLRYVELQVELFYNHAVLNRPFSLKDSFTRRLR